MVTFYKPVKKETVKKAVKVECSDLDLQGRGVARDGDNVYFVPGLMPGDTANVLSENSKGKIHQGKITKIIKPSVNRREKDCPLIGQCGGCQMQHVPVEMLIEAKIAGIRKLFKKALSFDIGEASFVHRADELRYRRACRFAIRGDHGKLYLGFREEKSHDLVKIKNCLTLSERMNNAIEPLNKAINSLNLKNKLGHLELLDSDGALGILVRFSATVDEHDVSVLESTGKELNAVISIVEPYRNPLEIKKKESLRERFICGSIDDLFIISHGVKIKCNPSSFVQVNKKINDKLLETVIGMIAPDKNTSVMDLFCGLGNFAMPLAKEGANVVGVDIVAKMIEDARANAKEQNLENVKFEVADLEELFENQKWAKAGYDAVVLDPGREGAKRATLFLAKKKVKKIVYISCNPLAASRDTIELIKSGYKIKQWGVCDMFPRTTHVEMVLEFTL